MTPPTFITRIESHRDPSYLWPLAGLGTVLIHTGLWLGFRPLMIATPAPSRVEADPIPVQLWLDVPPGRSDQGTRPGDMATVTGSEYPHQSSSQAAITTNSVPTSESDSTPVSSVPATPIAPTPTAPSPPLENLTPPKPTVLPPITPPPTPPVPTPVPASMPSVPAVTPPPPTPSPSPEPIASLPGSPSSESTGQLLAIGLAAASFGTDFPDHPPQLLDSSPMRVQPWLSLCGLANLAAIASPGLVARVKLQLQVQPDGRISQATVVEGTGNSSLDHLVSCVVQNQLRLQPATTGGTPQLTDAYILETQVRF